MSLPPLYSPLGEYAFDEGQNPTDPFALGQRSKSKEHTMSERSKTLTFDDFEKSQKSMKTDDFNS